MPSMITRRSALTFAATSQVAANVMACFAIPASHQVGAVNPLAVIETCADLRRPWLSEQTRAAGSPGRHRKRSNMGRGTIRKQEGHPVSQAPLCCFHEEMARSPYSGL